MAANILAKMIHFKVWGVQKLRDVSEKYVLLSDCLDFFFFFFLANSQKIRASKGAELRASIEEIMQFWKLTLNH